ncbi:hypothetical protein [Shewanella algae]|uniref:hypothetical protein n=1 Tax=Shewanella algae TaxID=38313 RepID=UPI0031F51720
MDKFNDDMGERVRLQSLCQQLQVIRGDCRLMVAFYIRHVLYISPRAVSEGNKATSELIHCLVDVALAPRNKDKRQSLSSAITVWCRVCSFDYEPASFDAFELELGQWAISDPGQWVGEIVPNAIRRFEAAQLDVELDDIEAMTCCLFPLWRDVERAVKELDEKGRK